MEKNKLHKTQQGIDNFQILLIVAFIIIIVFSVFIVILNSLNKSSTVLKEKVSSLISTIDLQMEINIDNYLKTIENTSTLVFSNEPIYNDVVTYKYDPIKNTYNDYDKIKIQDEINNKLIEIGLMENYCDFAIVYSDNVSIGKISKSTAATYPNNLYETLEPIVTRQRTNDGWYSGIGDEFVRLYYAKRLNENAILLTSFYVTELESILARPENMNSMIVRLVDSDNTIIYSSEDNNTDTNETGMKLEQSMQELIEDQDSAIITNDDYILSVSTCGDDWKIICSIPTNIILAENIETRNYTIAIGIVAVFASILAIVIITKIAARPVKGMVNNLNTKADIDLLTGIYNKITYAEKCRETMQENININYSFWIIDIDNFKNVNDTKGHAFGDSVISGVAEILHNVVGEKGIAGRIGGDEFSILLRLPKADNNESYINNIYDIIKENIEKFSKNVDYNITLSIGVTYERDTYDAMFKAADNALYKSKQNGKNKITIYKNKTDISVE